MGAVPSTPRWGSRSSFAARPLHTAEYLITTFIGDESFPISSDFWNKLLELPLNLQWQPDRVHQACQTLAQNNYHTRHLAKILIHMAWCLQESISTSSSAPSLVYMKAVNAVYISSIFLKYFIENAKDEKIEELHLSLDESEPMPTDISKVTGTEEKIGLNEADDDCCLHAAEDFVFLLQTHSFSTILPSSIMSVFRHLFGLVIFEVFTFLLYHLFELNYVFHLLFGLVIYITWVRHHLSEFNYVYVPFFVGLFIFITWVSFNFKI